jgi:hypothetical protein
VRDDEACLQLIGDVLAVPLLQLAFSYCVSCSLCARLHAPHEC